MLTLSLFTFCHYRSYSNKMRFTFIFVAVTSALSASASIVGRQGSLPSTFASLWCEWFDVLIRMCRLRCYLSSKSRLWFLRSNGQRLSLQESAFHYKHHSMYRECMQRCGPYGCRPIFSGNLQECRTCFSLTIHLASIDASIDDRA